MKYDLKAMREAMRRAGHEPAAPVCAEPEAGDDEYQEILSWDIMAKSPGCVGWRRNYSPYLMDAPVDETWEQRKKRMLIPLQEVCNSCSMCQLGRKYANVPGDHCDRDPHIFSSMNPSKYMVVGQNPGAEEVKARLPFVGPSGGNFDRELRRNGLDREMFYFTNAVKCWTCGNEKPTGAQLASCMPILQMEISILKPKLIIALGASAFAALCPDAVFSDSLKKLTNSRFGGKVFAVYHPSPRNLESREEAFRSQVKLLCALIKRMEAK